MVRRFDRELHPSKRYWLRLPQEDCCQATGTPSSLKYEADGGPGITDIARILRGSEKRDQDLDTLLRAQLVFRMLAATDGHAKNFSIRLLPEGRYRLTPLYDVLSAWPITGPRHDQIHAKKVRLALSLGGERSRHHKSAEMDRRRFNLTARQCGLGPDMEPVIADVVAATPKVIDEVEARLPKDFPVTVFDSITGGLRKAARLLAGMPPR